MGGRPCGRAGTVAGEGGTGTIFHKPVLLAEVVELLAPRPGERFVDGTLGAGGHARALAERLGTGGVLVGIDLDPGALDLARFALEGVEPRLRLVRGDFGDLAAILSEIGLDRVDGILLDLGLCSIHVDDPSRGFSFLRDGPLDLRFDPDRGRPARELLAEWDRREIARILRRYGEEPAAGRIAAAIVRAREKKPIETTRQLAELVESVSPRRGRRHPATRVFQALRIAVNDELGSLSRALAAAACRLATGGRLGVIAYHSLEDRMVKRFMTRMESPCICGPESPVCVCGRSPAFLRRTRRAVKPGEAELRDNPRARSARFRVAEKIGEPTEAMIDDAAKIESAFA